MNSLAPAMMIAIVCAWCVSPSGAQTLLAVTAAPAGKEVACKAPILVAAPPRQTVETIESDDVGGGTAARGMRLRATITRTSNDSTVRFAIELMRAGAEPRVAEVRYLAAERPVTLGEGNAFAMTGTCSGLQGTVITAWIALHGVSGDPIQLSLRIPPSPTHPRPVPTFAELIEPRGRDNAYDPSGGLHVDKRNHALPREALGQITTGGGVLDPAGADTGYRLVPDVDGERIVDRCGREVGYRTGSRIFGLTDRGRKGYEVRVLVDPKGGLYRWAGRSR